ncbi:hypothetical protein N2605_16245 [Bradyrhizobium yuanmingense]|uniref:hypothetical protein n=1 Tax=Bradyrhizobium yuanmingense TaxID=108015 RepID=UPI0021A7A526|nr:hypothetical protein [Bradyrhizobium sp. CB1024]UWU87927.1 hypothetical protein N2605_16245 [Bradyrhizobium sp. CB1024]
MSVAAVDLGGLTESNCCAACNGDHCVISGQPYCAHPRKGGLHHHQLQSDQGAMRRLQTARDMLLRSATELQIASNKA